MHARDRKVVAGNRSKRQAHTGGPASTVTVTVAGHAGGRSGSPTKTHDAVCGPFTMTGLSVLFLALAIDVAIADSYPQFSAPIQFCGSKLADHLRALCKMKYNDPTTPRPGKRGGGPNAPGWDYNDLYYNDYNTIDDPFGPNSETLFRPSGFLRPRNKRLITDECCKKPCTDDELKGYCHYSGASST